MSTFPGPLEEIENVSVDRFVDANLKSTVFFLSHHHSDHMEGIKRHSFINKLLSTEEIFLYCSPLTKLWLEEDFKDFNHKIKILQKIKTLDLQKEEEIHVPGLPPGRNSYLTVTTLPAGHCPGSVMFLFKYDSRHILYTGDIRMDVKNLKNMDALQNITIDTLYLDTSFYSPIYAYLPPREESMNRLVEFCKNWLNQHVDNIINIRRPAYLGIEYVYMHLFKEMHTPVHVSESEWQQYGRIPELAKAITCEQKNARIHACQGPTSKQKNALHKYPVERVRSVKLCTLHAKHLQKNDEIVSYDESTNLYRLVYSSHCSHRELKDIMSYLSPEKLVACVVPEGVTSDEIEEILTSNIDKSPASLQMSSFESTFEPSPASEPTRAEQPAQNCSQSSFTSISSVEESPAKPKTARYAISDSSDEESSPPKSEAANDRWAWAREDTDDKPWLKMSRKKMRRD